MKYVWLSLKVQNIGSEISVITAQKFKFFSKVYPCLPLKKKLNYNSGKISKCDRISKFSKHLF